MRAEIFRPAWNAAAAQISRARADDAPHVAERDRDQRRIAEVADADGGLQRRKLIRYRRGNITILARNGLEAAACGCYRASQNVGEFCVQLINALTGAELVPVPYTGAAPAIAALRGGHIEGVVLSLGALSNHINSGAFRGLVASSRFPEFADIPPMRDLGYREELFGIWFSFLAPAGIAEDARKALVGAIEQAVKAPAITARLRQSAFCRATPGPSRQRPRSARSSSG
jgi:hypothetical protein